MHGEYKVPGGKLVVVDVGVEDGALRHVRVAGDFFLEPDEALDAVNRALEGAPADTDTAGLAARIDAGLPEGTVMYGLTSEGVGVAVRRALALVADPFASLNSRSISTGPSPVFAVAVARPDNTARAAASASMASVLPWRRRAALSGWLTSVTSMPSARRCRVRAAP